MIITDENGIWEENKEYSGAVTRQLINPSAKWITEHPAQDIKPLPTLKDNLIELLKDNDVKTELKKAII